MSLTIALLLIVLFGCLIGWWTNVLVGVLVIVGALIGLVWVVVERDIDRID